MNNRNPNAALVLFSGGQDSTTCLFWARERFERVEAIGFDYGQKHAVELEQAKKIAGKANVPFAVRDIRGMLEGSALTEHNKEVSSSHEKNPDLPAAFVPGRNALFLSVAASYAYNRDIFDLVGGMCQTDYSGYPDCRRVFIESMETSLSLALDEDIRIHTPLMYLTKAETWKMATELNILELVRRETHTDYNGDRSELHEWGYGNLDNPASKLRARGYREAKEKGWV
jgi:7-cyano-7-deazaguanine synthase